MQLRFVSVWLVLLLLEAKGAAQPTDPHLIKRLEITGIDRTRRSTLTELMPRMPPALFSEAELRELERRISNLEIFDDVAVELPEPELMRIRTREKWSLVPELDMAGGDALEDMYVFVGATEYNVLGTANLLNVSVYRERRGFGFYTSYQEHVYRRNRWALAGEASYASSELRFADGEGWFNTTALLWLWATSPPLFSDHLRYEVATFYKRELIQEASGSVKPPDGHFIGGSMMFTWDAYQWHDLTPVGWLLSLSAAPGYFFSAGIPQVRAQADLKLKAALKLAQYTALMTRVEAGMTSRGNANHNVLIGSIRGVRGLADALYFNWLQVYGTLELRQALRFATRWALQGAVFVDAGGFERLTATGGRGPAVFALSAGFGLRVVPTWLSGLVLRFDVSHLFAPEPALGFQYGLSQYFF
jgi:hypothetical protein